MSLDWDDVNIFFTHLNPTIAAEFCCDAHVRKMLVESTQMLANVYHMEGATVPPPSRADGAPYAKSHWNHPCAVWVREDFKHFDWLRVHAYGLLNEWKLRFKTPHACEAALNYMTYNLPTPWLTTNTFLCPPLAMPEEFRSRVASPIGSYRNYIRRAKQHLHTWTVRPPPTWLITDYKALKRAADTLLEKCHLICSDAHLFRDELGCAPDLTTDDEWEELVDRANKIANGQIDEGDDDDIPTQLFNKCHLKFLGADRYRDDVDITSNFADKLTNAQWQVVCYVGEQYANALDPLTYPHDWNPEGYRG
jgi:hypothetical protein